MPPSNSTVVRSPTASTTVGRASRAAIAPSSCRPPWLETITPDAPWSRALARRRGAGSLDEDRQPGRLAEPFEVGPGARGVGEDPGEVIERPHRVRPRIAADRLLEDRVAEVVRQALPAQER